MPITDCKIHGESWIVEMCEHLHKDLEKGIYQTYFELPVMITRMCLKCAEKYDLQQIIDAATYYSEKDNTWNITRNYGIIKKKYPDMPKRIDFIYRDIMKNRGWKCTSCIEQIQLNYARKNNLELPFKPYENTLMNENDIDEYELAEHIENSNDKIDCYVEFGTPSTPFKISIHGKVSTEEKQMIMKTIDTYFEKISRKQRVVNFSDH